MDVCHEASPGTFLEFGKHPIGQSLKGPANAVLTGKRQCQPGGKQGAENQRGGHGKGSSLGEDVGDRWKKAAAREAAVSKERLTARAYTRNMPGFRLVFRLERRCHSRQFTRSGRPLLRCRLGHRGIISPRFRGMRGRIRWLQRSCRIRSRYLIAGSFSEESS